MMLSPIKEINFWTGILRDHGEFILTSLSYNEQEAIHAAKFYKESFSRLHKESKQLLCVNDPNAVDALLDQSMNLLLCFINFKKALLRKLLRCQINTSLPPTFYDHMINEAMYFYKILIKIQSHCPVNKSLENLKLHMIWLPDAAGHAAIIASDLDPTEKILIHEAQEFEKCFNDLTLKSQELYRMLKRTCLNDGALKQLNEDVKKKLQEFICFLDKLKVLKEECKVLGILKLIIPDHMLREANYYYHKTVSFE